MKPKAGINNNSTCSSSSTAKAETAGEELYLVHLRRHEGEEPRPEDFDFENPPKKRSSSVGEELRNVHVKRARGLDPDLDCDDDDNKPAALLLEAGSSASAAAPQDETPKEGDAKPCRYNLRTRRTREPKSP